MPVLFIRMSHRPKRSSTAVANSRITFSEITAQARLNASRPAALINPSVSSAAAMSAIATSPLSDASRCANACPMPLAPPDITATLPSWSLPIPFPLYLTEAQYQ